jgi:N-acetylmuramoyl-L-alanine amidase
MMTPHRGKTCLQALFLAAVVAGWLVAPCRSAATPTIERVSVVPTSNEDGFVVRLHSTDYVHAFSAVRDVGASKYEVILFNTDLAKPYQHDKPGGPVVAYLFEPDGEHLKFKFELDPSMLYKISVYRDRASDDLLVGLMYDGEAPARPVATLPPPKPNGPTVAARDRWKLDTIVIDPGHGGKDSGASAYGIREKDISLAIAQKLGELLETQLGVKVVYTRNNDRFVELQQRGKIANASGGKLFVSLHVNAQRRGRTAKGTETYFLGMHKSKAAQDVMNRENSVVSLEDNAEQYAVFKEEALIRQTLAQSAYMHKSEQLAAAIEKQFAERVRRQSRGVHQAGFYVLWNASMPAVLVELGFLTNRNEANFLNSKSGQVYMASALFRAIRDFKVSYERELNLVSSTR